MNFFRRYAVPLNLLVIAVTIVFVGAALVVGRAGAAPAVVVQVGSPSPADYVANRSIDVQDEAATAAERVAARNTVKSEYSINPGLVTGVRNDIAKFFEDLKRLAVDDAELSDVELAVREAGGINVVVAQVDNEVFLTGTVAEEIRAAVIDAASGVSGVTAVDDSGLSTETTVEPPAQSTTEPPPDQGTESTSTTTTTVAETTTTTIPRRPIEEWIAAMEDIYPNLSEQTITAFVTLYNNDLDRIANGEASLFGDVSKAADDLARQLMDAGIKQDDLADIRAQLRSETPPVFVSVLSVEERQLAHPAIGELVADYIIPNDFVDDELTQQQRDEAAAAVVPVTVPFPAFALIASEGETLSQVQVDAIKELDLVEKKPGTSRKAIVVLGALTVGLTAFFLWRLSPGRWSEPKHFALLGILVVLAALASRVPELVDGADGSYASLGFAIPAMLFGYVAAILYDPRTAVLLAVPVTTFVGISTADPAITIFAAGATVAPIAFVSSVSSRRQLRVAVALSALVLAPFAYSISWLFRGEETRWEAAFFGLVGGILAGLIAQSLVSFLENLFRMTTTLTLLDLVDRNHPALRLIEDKAPGTFNHSILVGTLAGKAARAIGADPLLAQAAAFYHDLGKVEDPVYFIENQFSITNPHDHLEPVDSCRIIRSHVTDGLRLARQYRLPSEIAEGIRCHHGTGLMRYFYHEATEVDPDVDPQLFRHHGEKPKRKEMAILMICDAVEGAARAHAQQQDPTEESLRKVVDSVVGEKLDDHQLDESDLTFGDLTKVKAAVVAALVGYYHTRVPYPGFPGPPVEQA